MKTMTKLIKKLRRRESRAAIRKPFAPPVRSAADVFASGIPVSVVSPR